MKMFSPFCPSPIGCKDTPPAQLNSPLRQRQPGGPLPCHSERSEAKSNSKAAPSESEGGIPGGADRNFADPSASGYALRSG